MGIHTSWAKKKVGSCFVFLLRGKEKWIAAKTLFLIFSSTVSNWKSIHRQWIVYSGYFVLFYRICCYRYSASLQVFVGPCLIYVLVFLGIPRKVKDSTTNLCLIFEVCNFVFILIDSWPSKIISRGNKFLYSDLLLRWINVVSLHVGVYKKILKYLLPRKNTFIHLRSFRDLIQTIEYFSLLSLFFNFLEGCSCNEI